MAGEKSRVPVDGGASLHQTAFDKLEALAGLGNEKTEPPPAAIPAHWKDETKRPKTPRARLEIRREKAGRAGKTVTTINGFHQLGRLEQEEVGRRLKTACGVGGTLRPGLVELQGDQRETASRLLVEMGYRVVLAGG